jgi:multidrug efflux pump
MLARFFVDRPIFAWVISIVIVLIGGVAVFTLPIAQYPEITPPTVQVTATYPGANAQVVADSIAAPIEQQVNGVENMLYMSSQCTNDGAYNLTVTFELGTNLDMAQVLVQNRVALALPQLPTQVQVQGVSTKKRSPSILLVVNLVSPDRRYDEIYLSNYATIFLKDDLARIKGVGDINLFGQRDYSMRVWLDPNKMASLNLTTADVVNAVSKQNVQVAAGQIGQQPVPLGQQFQYTMSTQGRLEDEKQFGSIVVKAAQKANEEEGTTSTPVVFLRDVARIELGAQQYDQISNLNGLPTVGMPIYQLPGSNALEVGDAIKLRMRALKKNFPEGVEYEIVYDTTPFVKESINQVTHTLIEAVVLVAIVVLFFLQDWKAMILPMIDVPVSLVGTFAVMAVMGFTLNNLTLFGLVLAIGIVVDDAIMVLENIERLIATGLDARTATIKAMDEITGPIVAITLVLCSVFVPCAFIPGVTGQFFRQFALTISAAMVISAINAMTLTPARAVSIFQTGEGGHEHHREALPWWIFGVFGGLLTVRYLKPLVAGHFGLPPADDLVAQEALSTGTKYLRDAALFVPGLIAGCVLGWLIIKPVNAFLAFIFRGFNKGFDGFTHAYSWSIGRMLRLGLVVLLIYGGLLVLTVRNMAKAPTGFIPVMDQGYLLVNVQLPDAASVQRTQEVMEHIQRIALGDDTGKFHGLPIAKDATRYEGIPGVAHTMSIAGNSALMAANGSNFGTCYIVLDPFDKRLDHSRYDEVIAGKLSKLCAQEIDDAVISIFRAPPIQGLGNAAGFKFVVQQRGYVDLQELQVQTDEMVLEGNKTPGLYGLFTLNRANTPQLDFQFDRTKCMSLGVDIQDVFNTLQVYMGGYYVNLFNKFGRTWQVNILAEPRFRTNVKYVKQLKVRNAENQMVPLGTLAEVKDIGGPVMVMRYNTYTGAAVNGATAPGVSSGQGIRLIDNLAEKLGVTFEWTEITFLQIKAGNVAMLVFALGTILVFLVLAAKYESWKLPAAVILVVPLCLLASVTGMLITKLPVDIFVQIGFLVLIGLAAKNAILIVEFGEQLRKEGKPLYEATVEASHLRLRPIIMTSFAFIFGVVPLVISHGAGAEMRIILGTAVFSGMLGVTLFGIFMTPVFYYLLMYYHKDKPAPAVVQPNAATVDGEFKHPPLGQGSTDIQTMAPGRKE